MVSCRGGARWAPLLLLPWEPAAAPRAGETGGIPEKCAGADAESPHFQAFQRFSLEKHRKLEYNTLIGDILDVAPQTAPIFLSIGMHCLGCPSSRGETVEEACMVHGVDCDKLLALVNEEANKKAE